MIVRSLTDDCNLAIQLPAEPGDAAVALGQLKDALDSLSGQARSSLNLELNASKCALLLPRGHEEGVADGGVAACFQSLRVHTKGMKVAGAPVGDDDYCVDFVADKVDAMETKLRALRGINPKVGILLLRKCAMPALLYLAQVLPSSLSSEPFARFEDMVADCVADMLTFGPGARGPPCPPDRLAVFLPPASTPHVLQWCWAGGPRSDRRCGVRWLGLGLCRRRSDARSTRPWAGALRPAGTANAAVASRCVRRHQC